MKLCDTSVVVDIDRGGVDQWVAKLDEEGRHAISIGTGTELRLGVTKRYETGTRPTRSQSTILPDSSRGSRSST